MADYTLDQLGKDAISAIVKPVSDKLNSQIDKIAFQARKKLATDRGVPESLVSDIEVAEYVSNLPSQQITKEVGEKMVYIGQSTRNGLIIGLGLIAISILLVGISRKKSNG
jgi:hypothetical protein